MKIKYILFLFLSITCFSQQGFQFKSPKNKIVIPFEFINNLIIIPLEINGTKLNFLLDTGVEESILFSLDDTDNVTFENTQVIKFIGLGNSEPFQGLKSSINSVKIKDYIDNNHTIFIVLDQEINISSQIGIPVNGVIGYHFFKNNPIAINYEKKKLYIYKNLDIIPKKQIKNYTKLPITLEENKPYINTEIKHYEENEFFSAKLLIDTGNSDGIWLFQERNSKIKIPNKNFEDFLGKGFGGMIYGHRGRIDEFKIDNFTLLNSIVSLPDSINTKNIKMVDNRVGSIGAEMLKRFATIYDYSNKNIYLKKNTYFNNSFNFNMSGIVIQHEGLEWVKESTISNPINSNTMLDGNGDKINYNFSYKFQLKPSYTIFSIRKDSPAEKAGLKNGDKIIKINNKFGYEFTLQDINDLLKSEENKIIEFEIKRDEKIMNFKFQLKSII